MTRDRMHVASYQEAQALPDEYVAGGIHYRLAQPSDNATISTILQQTPMTSWVTLSTEFSPEYFAAQDLFGNKKTILAIQPNANGVSPVGMCSYTTMPVFMQGDAHHVGYLGELRVLPAFRRRLSVVRHGFAAVKQLSEHRDRLSSWFTSIATENAVARRLLEANLRGMPRYLPVGEMTTLAMSVRAARPQLAVEPAQLDDIPTLIQFYNNQAHQFHYAPVLTEAWLRQLDGRHGLQLQDFYLLKEQGTLRACFAVWDQRQVKQTRVRAYRFPLNLLRQPYNVLARLSGGVTIPATGESINYVFIAFVAVTDEMRAEFTKLIRTALIYARQRNADLAMLGLATTNPLLRELEALPKKIYHTQIEAVTWPAGVSAPISLPTPGALVQPEIAIL